MPHHYEDIHDMNTHHEPLHRRSRSYEALVQLEAILEARHHQLMEHGALEEYDLKNSMVRDKTHLVMKDVQDEIARIASCHANVTV